MNILVADDNAITGEILCEMLRKEGHTAEWAATGEAAFSRMHYKDYDVVIVDYYMPTIDGLDVLRGMRKEPRTRNVPIVMITAAAPNEMVENLHKQLEELGQACFLQKPFDFDVLLLAIKKVTEKEQEK